MIGLLLNTLPLRTLVKREMPLLAWLKEVRLQWLAMRDFEHTPLANVQVWSEVPPGMPLFQSAVRFENRHWDSLSRTLGSSWSDSRVRFLLQTTQTNHAIDLAAYDGNELCLRLDFDRQRIGDVPAQRMLKHLKTLLEDMAINPNRRVGELKLLDVSERDTILRVWNDTKRVGHDGEKPQRCQSWFLRRSSGRRMPSPWCSRAGS